MASTRFEKRRQIRFLVRLGLAAIGVGWLVAAGFAFGRMRSRPLGGLELISGLLALSLAWSFLRDAYRTSGSIWEFAIGLLCAPGPGTFR